MRLALRFWPFFRFWIRLIFWGIRFILPLLLAAAHFIIGMCLNAAVGWWVGVPNACGRTAQDWVDRARRRRIPSVYHQWIYRLVWLETFIAILAGWIILSHLTVWLFEWLSVIWQS